jgi:hypothetical protein
MALRVQARQSARPCPVKMDVTSARPRTRRASCSAAYFTAARINSVFHRMFPADQLGHGDVVTAWFRAAGSAARW